VEKTKISKSLPISENNTDTFENETSDEEDGESNIK
jgi:hypothetical protein